MQQSPNAADDPLKAIWITPGEEPKVLIRLRQNGDIELGEGVTEADFPDEKYGNQAPLLRALVTRALRDSDTQAKPGDKGTLGSASGE